MKNFSKLLRRHFHSNFLKNIREISGGFVDGILGGIFARIHIGITGEILEAISGGTLAKVLMEPS